MSSQFGPSCGDYLHECGDCLLPQPGASLPNVSSAKIFGLDIPAKVDDRVEAACSTECELESLLQQQRAIIEKFKAINRLMTERQKQHENEILMLREALTKSDIAIDQLLQPRNATAVDANKTDKQFK